MKQPRFKVGQVVRVRKWKHTYFDKVTKILRPLVVGEDFHYILHGWAFALPQRFLRPLTKKEIANGK